MVAAIVAGEIAFWVLVVLGLVTRYVLRRRRVGLALLAAVPLVDVALLAASVVDLRHGGRAQLAHGLAAVYLGVSVAFGRQLIERADQRFAHRFGAGPAPTRPPRTGRAHAAYERRQWVRHLLAYVVAGLVLALFTALVGDVERARPVWAPMVGWGVVLVIDFIVSFSYTLAPRRPPA